MNAMDDLRKKLHNEANGTAAQGPPTLYDGSPAPYSPKTCPKRGKLVRWAADLDGRNGDSQNLYCKLCGASVNKPPYPEEMRVHV